jgi:hypothetical protein
MHVADGGGGHHPMQRRVNTGSRRVEVKAALGIQRHHFVLVQASLSVPLLQPQKLGLVEGSEPGAFGRTQVTTGALDPKYFHWLSGQRVGHGGFERGVPTADIRDSRILTEELGGVDQQVRRIRRGRVGSPTRMDAGGIGGGNGVRHTAP